MLSTIFGLMVGVAGEYILMAVGNLKPKEGQIEWSEQPAVHVTIFALCVLISSKMVSNLGETLHTFWLLGAIMIGLYWRKMADAWFYHKLS